MADTTVLSAFEILRSGHVVTDESKSGEIIISVIQGGVARQMNKSEFNIWNPAGSGGLTSVTGNPTDLVDNTDPLNPIVDLTKLSGYVFGNAQIIAHAPSGEPEWQNFP